MLLLHLFIPEEHRRERKLGYVAEFCVLCRGIRPCRLIKYGMEETILFVVPLGMKKVLGHRAVCPECSISQEVDPAKYLSIAKSARGDVGMLAQETFPGIHEAYAGRFELERALTQGRLTAGERMERILEILRLFEQPTEDNFRTTFQVRGPGPWVFGLTIVGTALITVLASGNIELTPSQHETFFSVALLGFPSGIILSAILMIRQPGRSFRKKIVPAMARALRPLDPSMEELTEALGVVKSAGLKVGKKTRLKVLWNAILRPSGAYEGFTSPQSGSFRSH